MELVNPRQARPVVTGPAMTTQPAPAVRQPVPVRPAPPQVPVQGQGQGAAMRPGGAVGGTPRQPVQGAATVPNPGQPVGSTPGSVNAAPMNAGVNSGELGPTWAQTFGV